MCIDDRILIEKVNNSENKRGEWAVFNVGFRKNIL